MTPDRIYAFLDEQDDYADDPYFCLNDKGLVRFTTAYPEIFINADQAPLILHWVLTGGGWRAILPESTIILYVTLYYTFPTGHDFAAAAEKTIEYLKRRRSRT